MFANLGKYFGFKPVKPFHYRALPSHAITWLWISGIVAALSCALNARSIHTGEYEVTGLTSLLQLGAVASALCVAWSMEWRDEIELMDGSRLGVATVMLAASEVSGMVDLQAVRGVAGILGMLVLTYRNSLGLNVVMRRNSLLGGRVLETAVLAGCMMAYYGLVLGAKLWPLDGGFTAVLLAVRAAATCAALLAMVANRMGERWPAINAIHISIGLGVLAVADIVYAHRLATPQGSAMQVALGGAYTTLLTLALGLITSSFYRRTPAKSAF